MRRHNKKGNGFYKIAKATPKYVSIDAVLVKVARDYLRKIAEAPADGSSNPGSTGVTPASPLTSADAGPSTQKAPSPTAAELPTPQSEGTSSGSGGSLSTGPSPSGQPAVQSPGSGGQGAASQSTSASSASGAAVSAQSEATGTEKKTVESPSTKRSPNYLKNLALLVGIPLTIASLAGGVIRGFNMSSLIGLGLGAVATVYGVGFLDYLKDKFYKDIEKLERGEINTFFNQPGQAPAVVQQIYSQDVPLLTIPPDYSTEAERVPREFKTLYGLAHEYIMGLYEKMHQMDSERGIKPKHLLHKIFGYEYRGAEPYEDMINSLNKGRDLERHATIIVLANMLKHIERTEGRERAIDVFKNLLERMPYWYFSSWGATGWDQSFLNWIGFAKERPYLADPWTLLQLLQRSTDLHFTGKEDTMEAIRMGKLSYHLMQAARNFDVEDAGEEAQAM
jgi:hypothetical protein